MLADPFPTALLDRSAGDSLEIAVSFCTADDMAALVRSDLIKAVHAALDAHLGEQASPAV